MGHKFSIIIPAYNAEAFVVTALTCVQSQTFKDYEVILIDNGSRDATYELVKKFADENSNMDICILKVPDNIGISGARNMGIDYASGEYISFLDVDDFWCENKLERVYERLESEKEIDVCCHWEVIYQLETESVVGYNRYPNVDETDSYKDMLCYGNKLSTSAVTMKKEVASSTNGFDKRYVSGEEDYDFWLRIAKRGYKFSVIREFLGEYRLHGTNVSGNLLKHTEAVGKMLQDHVADLKNEKIYNPSTIKRIERKIQSRTAYIKGRTYSSIKDRRNAVKAYLASLRYDPLRLKTYAAFVLLLIGR